jgi:hypothetical protein
MLFGSPLRAEEAAALRRTVCIKGFTSRNALVDTLGIRSIDRFEF